MHFRILFVLTLVLLPKLPGQVVFSRRVYRTHGLSYQQLWIWDPRENRLQQLTDSPRDHFSPDCSGQQIRFISPEEWQENAKLWSFDTITGQERSVGPVPHESAEGVARPRVCEISVTGQQACAKGGELSISYGGKEVGKIPVATNDLAIESLAWSPSGRWLLIRTIGADTNSSSPQSDLFVLEPSAMRLKKAGSGNDGSWVPGRDALFFTTPRRLALLAGSRRPRGVWVSQLMTFDPDSNRSIAITSGLTNNLDASACQSSGLRFPGQMRK